MSQSLELPSYLEKEPAVVERFQRIYKRPVVLDVQHLGKTFESCATWRNRQRASRTSSFKTHRREFIRR